MTTNYPLQRKPIKPFIEIDNYLFCDFETNGLGGDFIIGATCDEDDNILYFHHISSFVEFIRNEEKTCYFHNLEYDGRYIIKYLMENSIDFEIIVRGQKLLLIDLKFFQIIDTYAVLSDSLKNLSKIFAPEYEKKTLDFENEIFDSNNPEHIEYLKYDVLALKYVYLNAAKVIYDVFSVNMGYTAASIALNYFLTITDKKLYRLSKSMDDFVRKSYSGGFVFIKAMELYKDIYVMDFNSMYPSVMRDYKMPIGNARYTDKFEGIGFYHCEVNQKEAQFKFLYGYNKQGKKSARHTEDIIECYISDKEYILAKKLGYKLKIKMGIVFDETDYIFTDFVNKCEELRLANKKNAIGAITKLMQNSLYGKFGSKKEKEHFVFSRDIVEGYIPVIIDNKVSDLQYKIKIVDKNYMLPHLASYITSLARCRLVQCVVKAGIENTIYCDTDSVFVNETGRKNIDDLVGEKYGMLKEEYKFDEVLTLAPKLYFDKDGKKSSIKGFPKKRLDEIYNQIVSGTNPKIFFTGLSSVKSIMKNGSRFYNNTHRSINIIPQEIFDKIKHWES